MTARAPATRPAPILPATTPYADGTQGAFPFDAGLGLDPTPSQADGAGIDPPPYGSLDNHAEHRLYRSDYPAWCQYVAPRWVEMLQSEGGLAKCARFLRESQHLKRAVWRIAPEDLRKRLASHFADLKAAAND